MPQEAASGRHPEAWVGPLSEEKVDAVKEAMAGFALPSEVSRVFCCGLGLPGPSLPPVIWTRRRRGRPHPKPEPCPHWPWLGGDTGVGTGDPGSGLDPGPHPRAGTAGARTQVSLQLQGRRGALPCLEEA